MREELGLGLIFNLVKEREHQRFGSLSLRRDIFESVVIEKMDLG